MNLPKLTIIIPCYNCEKTLESSLNSCFKQNLSNYEIVLVDDFSSDKTRALIESFANKNPNLIKTGFHTSNKGGGYTRNTAISLSSGEIIFCLDSDDVLGENSLLPMYSLLINKKLDGVLFSETRFFENDDFQNIEIIKNRDSLTNIDISEMFEKNAGFLTRVNFMYTRHAFEISGGYPEHHGFDTQTFGFRFLANGLKVKVCPNTFYYHRRNTKLSYFDREYKKGNLSINTYLMYEDIFHLFSERVKNQIINFDIQKKHKLGKQNLEQTIFQMYERLGKNDFFIPDYLNYVEKDGKIKFLSSIKQSTNACDLFAKSLIQGENMTDILRFFPKSKILRLKANKKIILLMHNGGRLGNQMWLIASLYSYCLFKKYTLDIRCFFEYQQSFNIKIYSPFSIFLGKTYNAFQKMNVSDTILRDVFYFIYNIIVDIFAFVKRGNTYFDPEEKNQHSLRILFFKSYKTIKRIISYFANKFRPAATVSAKLQGESLDRPMVFLPPSTSQDIIRFEQKDLYLIGWLFRNPLGIEKYQKEITKFFTPKYEITKKIAELENNYRQYFKHIVGVHIRLGDCLNEFIDGEPVAYTEDSIKTILEQYLKFDKKNVEDVCFIICSDGKINKNKFGQLNIETTSNSAIEDMWLLSKTDVIIGADSSFAIMASLLGNIPFIVFNKSIDWEYYRDKTRFFVNKYVKRFIY